jgi:ketosteroid isomerase-like protein
LVEDEGVSARDDLEARVALLEAERAVLKTLHRYGHAIDYGDEEAWVDCFTEDGVFDIRARLSHQPNRIVSGRDELRAFIARHTRAPELWHKHLLVEPVIEVDGDTATCSSYLAVVMEHDDEPLLRVFGRYRDRLVRCPDGRWRFLERIAEVESMRRGLPPFVDGRPPRA